MLQPVTISQANSGLLAGKKGLIVGVANSHSIATGCAAQMRAQGAEIALTYLNEKAKSFVAPVAEEVGADMLLPMDVTDDAQIEAVFDVLTKAWGKLDFLIHSIAFSPMEDLHGRVVDSSREGFLQAMDVSVHSLMRLSKAAEPLMMDGGSIMTVSYYGAEKVVDHYNLMGPVKSALESAVRYMAVELGPKKIRVNTLSPGPIATRAASGIAHFDELINAARERAPEGRLVTIEEVGDYAVFLASDLSRMVTGEVCYIDGGYNIIG